MRSQARLLVFAMDPLHDGRGRTAEQKQRLRVERSLLLAMEPLRPNATPTDPAAPGGSHAAALHTTPSSDTRRAISSHVASEVREQQERITRSLQKVRLRRHARFATPERRDREEVQEFEIEPRRIEEPDPDERLASMTTRIGRLPSGMPASMAVAHGMLGMPSSVATDKGARLALDEENGAHSHAAPGLGGARATSGRRTLTLSRSQSFMRVMSGGADAGVECDSSDEGDAEIVEAAERFNKTHVRESGAARGLLTEFGQGNGRRPRTVSAVESTRFNHHLLQVRRNRLWTAPTIDPEDPPPRPALKVSYRARRRWSLVESVWHPRQQFGNSRDFYETDDALGALLDLDWHLASSSHGLASAIIKRETPAGGKTFADADGNGVHDSLDRAHDVLRDRARLVYDVFDYYAALMEEVRDRHGEVNIYSMGFNAYLEFARECALMGETCQARELEIIWVQVNALSPGIKGIDRFNHARRMVRHEFVQALVRIAMLKYISSHSTHSVADAVSRLLNHIEARVPPEVHQDSNSFRRRSCYQELTDHELRKHYDSLRSLYQVYSSTNRNVADGLQSARMMSIGEWLLFLEHMGFFVSGQLALSGAKLIFLWSRIRSSRDYSDGSELKLRNLFFEDFLEALVRVASTIALPTDAELAHSKASSAGVFMMALATSQAEMKAFVDANKTGWRREPRQRVARCVAHLVSLLVHVVEENLKKVPSRSIFNGKLSQEEVGSFELARRRGSTLVQMKSATALLDGIRAAASIVRKRLLDVLHRVELFSAMEADQLELLCDTMADAPFDRGQYVFEQGDEGDAFYVIAEGTATVLRDEGDGAPIVLAELGEGAYFGERALLKDQLRFAGVLATSAKLHTMRVTRPGLEEALGRKLEELVPDKYRLEKPELCTQLAQIELFQALSAEQLETARRRDGRVPVPSGQLDLPSG